MSRGLTIRYFAHSWVSDWNHGNAHFLRGLAREVMRLGHNLRCYEQLGSWSLKNLMHHEGERAIDAIDHFRRSYPELNIHFYKNDASFKEFAAEELKGADVVVVHEWNDPHVVNTILSLKAQYGFRALLHDTHHRAYTRPAEILKFHLHLFDGVLAFGDALRRIYTEGFGINHAWTFHEAADVTMFQPLAVKKEIDILWIGNWGDEERTRELMEFLIQPAASMTGRRFVVHGVRYPEDGVHKLHQAGIDYRGYLPNLRSPIAYSQSEIALHVPRRQYTNGLSGVPTIRVFEALACGAPLLCSPWEDSESLFRAGEDYLCVSDGESMKAEMEHLLRDDAARRQLASNGLETVRARHTCRHRAEQLIDICEGLLK
jgi:spore maturation protein CgeB